MIPPDEREQIHTMSIAVGGIAAIVLLGGVLGQVFGPAQIFVMISIALAIWSIAGWFFGGLRAVLAGVAILTAALAASGGTASLALVMSGAAFLLLFAGLTTPPVRLGKLD